MISVLLTDKVILLPLYIAQVESPLAGAIVTFNGNIRSVDQGKEVVSLSYEIHPSTEQVLEEVAHSVALGHDVIAVAIAHRYGDIALGESALIVAISATHRGEAFVACSAMVDEIKARIPIWKHQVFADGTDEWVNCA